jgi:fructokinase/2-dehydro-3-deoxygluconokinase
MKQNRVIILGDANVDLVIHLPDRSGGMLDMSGSVPQIHGGGSAANVAVAVARLNQEVTFVGAIGNDGYGHWVTDELAGEKVDVTGLYPLDDKFTPMVLALIEPSGERMVVVWPPEDGAHHFLPPSAIHTAFFQGAGWLHASGMCLRKSPARETILQAMEKAKAKGIPVSLDLNIRNEMWGYDDETRATFERAVSLSDVVFGNAEEEICLVARNSSIDQALNTLSAGNRTIIARIGADGAYVSASSQLTHVPGFEVEVVDTLGAGDAFDGGFITARMEGLAVTESVRWGNAVAALKIGRSSGRGTPRRHELTTFLNS